MFLVTVFVQFNLILAKMQGYIHVSWIRVFWPAYIFIGFCIVMFALLTYYITHAE